MPGKDGITLLAEVRKHYGNIPFIRFTGKVREEVVIQAINNGADFYLQKGGEPGHGVKFEITVPPGGYRTGKEYG